MLPFLITAISAVVVVVTAITASDALPVVTIELAYKRKNTTRDGGGATLYTFYIVYAVKNALHCLNSRVYANIYC